MEGGEIVKVYESNPYLLEFLDYMGAIKSRSTNTIREYGYDIALFLRFTILQRQGKIRPTLEDVQKINDLSEVNQAFLQSIQLGDLYRFISWLANGCQNGTAARARRSASLRAFFGFLHGKLQIIPKDPSLELENPKKARSLPRYFDLEEALELLKVAALSEKSGKNEAMATRNYCILVLFLNCGLRLAELCSINISDLREDYLVVKGKGNKERNIYLNNQAQEALHDWLAIRVTLASNDPDALFISNRKQRIARRTVQALIKDIIIEAGFDPNKYSVHKLRHTAATLMYQSGGVDIRALQDILGHESIATTEIYTHINQDILHEAVSKNPLNTYGHKDLQQSALRDQQTQAPDKGMGKTKGIERGKGTGRAKGSSKGKSED